ncbi:MAG: peroxiredoxin [Pseudomonadota bacterium]
MTKSLEVGNPAPAFSLETDTEGTVTLSDYAGAPLVLYFYPKDDTSGCTKEAIAFTELADDFAKAGAKILGVSPDSVAKHEKFRTKHELGIALGSDEEKSTLEAYGVWVEKSMYGRKYMGVERSTFLIDGSGTVARVWRKVKVPGHAEEVLSEVQSL